MAYVEKCEKWRSEFEAAGFDFDEIDFVDVPADAIDAIGNALRELQLGPVGDLIQHIDNEMGLFNDIARNRVMRRIVGMYGVGSDAEPRNRVELSAGDTVYIECEDGIVRKGEAHEVGDLALRCRFQKDSGVYLYRTFEWGSRGTKWWLIVDTVLTELIENQGPYGEPPFLEKGDTVFVVTYHQDGCSISQGEISHSTKSGFLASWPNMSMDFSLNMRGVNWWLPADLGLTELLSIQASRNTTRPLIRKGTVVYAEVEGGVITRGVVESLSENVITIHADDTDELYDMSIETDRDQSWWLECSPGLLDRLLDQLRRAHKKNS